MSKGGVIEQPLFCDLLHRFVENTPVLFSAVDLYGDRLGEVERENTHDRFGVNDIPPGYDIDIKGLQAGAVDKALDVTDRTQLYEKTLHAMNLLKNLIYLLYTLEIQNGSVL
jgi:hypothetical protein